MEIPTDQKDVYDANTNLLTSEKIEKDILAPTVITNNKKSCRRIAIFLFCGLVNLVFGILSIHYNYVELIMEERIRMRPGLPPLEWWRNPPISIYISVNLFNVTNPIQFLDGIDDRLKLQEIGPIVYAETIRQTDVVHHANSTLSFTTERSIRFVPEANEPNILNKSIIIINPFLLGMASYVNDANFVKKLAFRMLSSNDNVFMRRNIYDILWNSTTPMLQTMSTSILSVLVPRNNSGILYNAYYPKTSRYNVKIGTKNGFENFFKINNYNGHTKIPGWENEERDTCPIWLDKSTDGANLPPYVTKESIVTAWREDICTTVDFHFEKEVKWQNFNAYKFTMPSNSFDRLENRSQDCHKGFGETDLPNGLIDASKCSFDIPIAISMPHFYGSDGFFNKTLEGLNPDKDKHGSFSIVEPTTGFPLEETARIQSNLVIPKLEGFNDDIMRFSNIVLPGFWIEYTMKGLPSNMAFVTELIVIYTPIIQILMIIILFTLGIGFSYFGIIYLQEFLRLDNKSPRKIIITKMNSFKVKRLIATSNKTDVES